MIFIHSVFQLVVHFLTLRNLGSPFSGAHVALLMLVNRAEQHCTEGSLSSSPPPVIDSFVGLSGPYDISHHFDYEAARGVEELSPMKPSCGHSREGFRHFSPALRLQASLARFGSCPEPVEAQQRFPSTLLLHGIEDTTVPFTATAEAARVLRACGVINCQELYVAETGHQDTVVQLMLGGRTQSLVVDWILGIDEGNMMSATHNREPWLMADSKL